MLPDAPMRLMGSVLIVSRKPLRLSVREKVKVRDIIFAMYLQYICHIRCAQMMGASEPHSTKTHRTYALAMNFLDFGRFLAGAAREKPSNCVSPNQN